MHLNYEIEKNIHPFQQVSEPHFHDGYEVLICLADGGKFYIQEHAYPLCRKMMFILPPRVLHRCIVDVASYERYILHFSQETLWQLSSFRTNLQTLFDSCNYYTVLSDQQLTQLNGLMDACLRELPEFGDDLRRDLRFMETVLEVSKILCSDTRELAPTPSKEFQKVLPIIEYIHEHYQEDLTLDVFCQNFYISKHYLCHQFKKLTGFGVGDYLLNYRIRQACCLLRGGMSVQEAGSHVGFKNNAHFIRRFREVIGVTPGKYVKSLQYRGEHGALG